MLPFKIYRELAFLVSGAIIYLLRPVASFEHWHNQLAAGQSHIDDIPAPVTTPNVFEEDDTMPTYARHPTKEELSILYARNIEDEEDQYRGYYIHAREAYAAGLDDLLEVRDDPGWSNKDLNRGQKCEDKVMDVVYKNESCSLKSMPRSMS